VTALFYPGMQRVIAVASRKGVTLDIRLMRASRLTHEEIAAAVGAELGQIVKSVVCVAPRPGSRVIPVVCLVSGRNQVDLDLLAMVTGEPAVRETTAEEAHALFGYPAGGVPPFGHGHDVVTVMDQDLSRYQWLWAAAGTDSAVFRVAPGTLRMLANAVVAPVAQASWMRPAGFHPIGPSSVRGRIRRTERSRRPRAEDGPS
jgi:prolyl-tRNA editing enzyme YbaK/EbsC (Cys-tRNA(Pro) deacylase)